MLLLSVLALRALAGAAPSATPCPSGIDANIHCLAGQDSAGAFYLIAMPGEWNDRLVLHAHGGPFLGAPSARRVAEDLQRWSVIPRAGYAWAASSYCQGGVAVMAAAEDTERLHQLVVYQALCANHPRPDEPQYPLWMGLPPGAKMSAADLARRSNECLGLDQPAAQRSAEPARKLKTLSDATYVALLNALQAWVEPGHKPTSSEIAVGCVAAQKTFASSCRFRPDYQPAALETRVPARH